MTDVDETAGDRRHREAPGTEPQASGAGGGPATPQPEPPRPRLVAGEGGGRGPGSTWLLIVVVLLLLILALTALWLFVLRDEPAPPQPSPSPSPASSPWVGAWTRTDGAGGGGGLTITAAGSAYKVALFDAALQPAGSVPATATAEGRELRFTLPPQFPLGGPAGPLTAALTAGTESGTALLTVTGADGAAVSVGLIKVPALTSFSATPSPSVAPSTSPSVTATPGPAPEATAEALRQEMIAAIGRLQAGIEAWAADNGRLYPAPSAVRAEGSLAPYVAPWPVNPWAQGRPLVPGLEVGDYVYDQLDGGLGYRLTGVLDNGSFIVP